ncbi:hypothetical protein F5B21DRAFT_376310 [Xylaria acuta]|nr:hypothetical protein F5B21DRAFT_376310 [Xylaria acuta]
MQLNAVAAFALIVRGVSAVAVAVLRFRCLQIVVERLDPLVNPDVNPSPHMHQVYANPLKVLTTANELE